METIIETVVYHTYFGSVHLLSGSGTGNGVRDGDGDGNGDGVWDGIGIGIGVGLAPFPHPKATSIQDKPLSESTKILIFRLIPRANPLPLPRAERDPAPLATAFFIAR